MVLSSKPSKLNQIPFPPTSIWMFLLLFCLPIESSTNGFCKNGFFIWWRQNQIAYRLSCEWLSMSYYWRIFRREKCRNPLHYTCLPFKITTLTRMVLFKESRFMPRLMQFGLCFTSDVILVFLWTFVYSIFQLRSFYSADGRGRECRVIHRAIINRKRKIIFLIEKLCKLLRLCPVCCCWQRVKIVENKNIWNSKNKLCKKVLRNLASDL